MATKDVTKKSAKSGPKATESGLESVFAPLLDLRHRIDDLFDDFTEGWRLPSVRRHPWSPDTLADFPSLSTLQGDLADIKFDVADSDDAIEISAELPGMDEKDVDLSLSNGVLTIKGEKKTETEEKKKDYYCRERRFGSFVRSFRVPDSVDEAKIKASFDKGVLEIALPKKSEAKAKTKKISVSKKK